MHLIACRVYMSLYNNVKSSQRTKYKLYKLRRVSYENLSYADAVECEITDFILYGFLFMFIIKFYIKLT